jgi:hypothetical protein
MKISNITFNDLIVSERYSKFVGKSFEGQPFIRIELEIEVVFRGRTSNVLLVDQSSSPLECEEFEALFARYFSR